MTLDLAAMLARRAKYRHHGPTYRYLAFGASPQRGVEVFAIVERVVVRSELENGGASKAEERRLPLAALLRRHRRMPTRSGWSTGRLQRMPGPAAEMSGSACQTWARRSALPTSPAWWAS